MNSNRRCVFFDKYKRRNSNELRLLYLIAIVNFLTCGEIYLVKIFADKNYLRRLSEFVLAVDDAENLKVSCFH